MKNLTKKSADKKINELLSTKTLNKQTLVYGWINQMLDGQKIFRPVYTQGTTWKHSSIIDKTNELTHILRLMGVEYITGNDAPRGGKTGIFVGILTKMKS